MLLTIPFLIVFNKDTKFRHAFSRGKQTNRKLSFFKKEKKTAFLKNVEVQR